MKIKYSLRITVIYIVIAIVIPLVLLLNAFLIPEPYSHPLINVAIAPTHLMPFLEDKELLHKMTLRVFDRQTPNYAPITIVILIIFWFFTTIIMTFIVRHLIKSKQSHFEQR